MNKENLDKINSYFQSKKLSSKDFEENFKNKDYNSVYERLIVLTWKLAHSIARERLESRTSGCYDDESEIVKGLFNSKKNDLGFYDLYDALTKWHERIEIPYYYEDGESRYIFRQKEIAGYICELYDDVLENLKKYCIKSRDYYEMTADEIIAITEKQAIKLFKEMLDAIDEKYEENWNLEKWIEVMDLNYIYFSDKFDEIKYYYSNRTSFDPIIVNMKIEEECEILEDEYKSDVEFYKKYKLKEGQTYLDLYNEKYEEFEKLLKEMLEFVGVKIDEKREDPLTEVMIHYPYYADNLTHLRVIGSLVAYTTKDMIQTLDSTYKYLKSTYKNHEENLKNLEYVKIKDPDTVEEFDFKDEDLEDENCEDKDSEEKNCENEDFEDNEEDIIFEGLEDIEYDDYEPKSKEFYEIFTDDVVDFSDEDYYNVEASFISNFKIVKDIDLANCITHSGKFHTDEVFATVILVNVLDNVKLIRLNEVPKNVEGKIVYDIGGGKFDHHQLGGNGERENGIQYASCGLIWNEYGKTLLKKYNLTQKQIDELFDRIDNNLIQYIDASDNGQTPIIQTDYRFIELRNIISTFNTNWDEYEQDTDDRFIEVVEFMNKYFDYFIKKEISKIKAKDIVESAIENSENGIMMLDLFVPWKEFISTSENPKAKEIYYVIFPSNRVGYNVSAVPKEINTLENKKDFPKKWGGLKDKELQEVTNVKTAIFCHKELFLCSAETKEDAIKLATIAINENN